jgi:hypothetical protein
MAVGAEGEPGGGGGAESGGGVGSGGGVKTTSYADRLKTNVNYSQRLKRNILEITLEKVNKNTEIEINQEDTSRVFRTLGIDITSQVEGHQVHYKGRNSVISVWMANGINVEKFCKDVNIKVNSDVITGMIRPAGRTDVTVSIIGLDFNTPDTFVIEYLSKFGIVKSKSVIYSKFEEGPFKGKFNGERRYQVDFSGSRRHMGTYHLIDNSKVRVFYRGNMKTCGRCHKFARDCAGGGLARECDAGGGQRVMLSEHMRRLWIEIDFVPSSFALDSENVQDVTDNIINDAPVLNDKKFPSNFARQEPSENEIEKCDGITVKNIPLTVDEKGVWTFLINYGLPLDHGIENVRMNRGDRNTWVVINGLKPEDIKLIHNSLHFPITKQKFFDSPIYCKPLRNLTPAKPAQASSDNLAASTISTPSRESTSTSPSKEKTELIVPGLTKSQQKKAIKRAKEKAKKEEERKKAEEKKKVDPAKPKVKLVKKDFLKEKTLDEIDIEYNFETTNSDDEDVSKKEGQSKFFTKGPNEAGHSLEHLLSPALFDSTSAKKIQKEEMWKNKISQQNKKRLISPTNQSERNTRPRSESLSLLPRHLPVFKEQQ